MYPPPRVHRAGNRTIRSMDAARATADSDYARDQLHSVGPCLENRVSVASRRSAISLCQRLSPKLKRRRARSGIKLAGWSGALVELAILVATVSCGDGASTPTTAPRTPTTLSIVPATAEFVALADTVQFTAEVRDQNGQTMNGTLVAWRSADPLVAAVNPSGLARAVGNGTTTIAATAGSASGVAMISVQQEATSVDISPPADTLVEGDTLRLVAAAADANGYPVDSATFVWQSSDEEVAVVDTSGLVRAIAAGETVVTATHGTLVGQAEVAVEIPIATSVEVTPDTTELTAVGATARLVAEVLDQIGRVMVGVGISWTSSDTSVVAVDSIGLIRALANGISTITATAGSVHGTAWVTVAQSVRAIGVSPSADTIAPGDTLRLVALATDKNGFTVSDANISWRSDDGHVASVEGTGLVQGVAEGEATITATVDRVTGTATITVLNPDREILAALYHATGGENWDRKENWLTDAHIGYWRGVTTDDAGRVIGLHLVGRGLTGSIPPELGELSALQWLTLTINQLTGSIPPELDNLTNLRGLALGQNQLTGSIPSELGRLADLESLILYGNLLTGSIPAELGNLARLQRLHLGGNRLTGTIPSELGNLTSLRELSISGSARNQYGNRLTGPIPAELGRLVELRGLTLDGNQLTGSIPVELGNLANLRTLALNSNQLTGSIPAELGNLDSLQSLNLGRNKLTGSIPAELGRPIKLKRLWLNTNQLTGSIPSGLGSLDSLQILQLAENTLTGSIPVDLGRLTHLNWLILSNNQLTGSVPRELGRLGNLAVLRLEENQLTGSLPEELTGLDALASVYILDNHGLCAPGTSPFVAWAEQLNRFEGAFCNEGDIEVLKTLYRATGGMNWRRSDGWLESGVLSQWHGLTTDSIGQVSAIDLSNNGLSGRLPSSLGRLNRLLGLQVGGNNGLTGPVPSSLRDLGLEQLHYGGTGICEPADPHLRRWLEVIPSHRGTGVECAPLSDRDILVSLFHELGGEQWHRNDNWLTDKPIGDWYGVVARSVGGNETVTTLNLGSNRLSGTVPPALGSLVHLEELDLGKSVSVGGLTGSIPAELGNLTNLRSLDLSLHDLTGSIPPELGNLAQLEVLRLRFNQLTGSIPAELGKLGRLRLLWLGRNQLSGSIPPEMGNLVSLAQLDLSENRLTGSIPPEMGNLAKVGTLYINSNQLTGSIAPELGELRSLAVLNLADNQLIGSIPAEMGNLGRLWLLYLNSNQLTGSIPPEMGRLHRLKTLDLAGNALSGFMPADLTALSLDVLRLGGTSVCAPRTDQMRLWLNSIGESYVAICASGGTTAYLTQAVQSRSFPVPLVAGADALLRVFVHSEQASGTSIPAVRATFFRDGRQVHLVEIPGQQNLIPAEFAEDALSKSANALIPGQVLQPGLEMVVEVDPDGTVDPQLGVRQRIPAIGSATVEVREMPTLDLTIVPFLYNENPDTSVAARAERIDGDDELLAATRTLLPVSDMEVTVHDRVWTSVDPIWSNRSILLRELNALRVAEGGSGHYMGVLRRTGGVASRPGKISLSGLHASTIAHELGHNMNLQHAPCGGADLLDPYFPDPEGSIGAWGYDLARGGTLVPPHVPDLMSYCGPEWVSGYSFAKALEFRLRDESSVAAGSFREATTQSLLLWGGIDREGNPVLEPTFVLDAPPSPPTSHGLWRVVARSAANEILFSYDFAMPEVADAEEGAQAFAFAVPVSDGLLAALASVTLAGPSGTTTIDQTTNRPIAMLRDPQTGRLRGILRNLPGSPLSRSDATYLSPEPGLEVIVGRGLPRR